MRHAPPILALALLLGASGCEQPEPDNPYQPGGAYTKRLDARGRRHVVRDADGAVLAKVRVLETKIKVYSPDMKLLGSLLLADELAVQRGQAAPVVFESTNDSAAELAGSFRVERIDAAWAVFDRTAQRLGYFEWLPDGRLALRDDYSSPPRVFATSTGTDARTPAGQHVLSITPALPAARFLPFALEGDLDALDRLALGEWLLKRAPAPTEGG